MPENTGLPIWAEWIVAITTILANIVAITTLLGAIVLYLKNRVRKEKLPLIEARFVQSKHIEGLDKIDERTAQLFFYNETNRVFYISECFVEHENFKTPLPIFSKEINGNDRNYETKLNTPIMPNAPAVINGVFLASRDFTFPRDAMLLVILTNGKSFRYELNKCHLVLDENFA